MSIVLEHDAYTIIETLFSSTVLQKMLFIAMIKVEIQTHWLA